MKEGSREGKKKAMQNKSEMESMLTKGEVLREIENFYCLVRMIVLLDRFWITVDLCRKLFRASFTAFSHLSPFAENKVV